MANTYFQFREFIIHQERSAMKVCTDACLFGAWTAVILAEKVQCSAGENHPSGKACMLDIGTGTGLLSLMLAQQLQGPIDAVELEGNAYSQAAENVQNSPWSSRIAVHHADIRQFNRGYHYELVISNPPFFEKALKSSHSQKNLAKHESDLDLPVLFSLVQHSTTETGWFSLLLPAERAEAALQNAQAAGMHLRYQAMVKQTEKHGYFRAMLIFSKANGPVRAEAITIRSGNSYSDRFKELLAPYYLSL